LPFYDFASPEDYAVLARCGVDLISDVLPFGRLWYGEPNAISNAIDYAKARRLILRENSRPLSLVVFGMSEGC
jgi:hypothetical protein